MTLKEKYQRDNVGQFKGHFSRIHKLFYGNDKTRAITMVAYMEDWIKCLEKERVLIKEKDIRNEIKLSLEICKKKKAIVKDFEINRFGKAA